MEVSYWAFFAKKNRETAPLIIYFLEDGMLIEIFYGNGPFRLEGNNVIENKDSWTNFANVLYYDLSPANIIGDAYENNMPKNAYKQAQLVLEMIYDAGFFDTTWRHKDLYIGADGEYAKVVALAAKMTSEDHTMTLK